MTALVRTDDAELSSIFGGLAVQPWAARALCAESDPEQWFPEAGTPIRETRQARAMCRRCEARPDCLMWAIDNRVRFGIWGGMTPREIRALKTLPTTKEHTS